MLEINRIYNIDCIEGMKEIKSGSIHLIVCDLPFGITENEWDNPLPFDFMWEQYLRIIKDNGAIVLMGCQPFTSMLIASQIKLFRYCYVWKTKEKRNFLNANKMPLREHIDIPVFYKKLPTYNPQKTQGHKPVNKYKKHSSDGSNYGKTKIGTEGGGQTDRFPTSIIDIPYKTFTRIHPTQKPIELMEWIIKTYTNENDLVLDNCCGYGSSIIACIRTGRNYIGMDNGYCKKDGNKGIAWAEMASQRIENFKNTQSSFLGGFYADTKA